MKRVLTSFCLVLLVAAASGESTRERMMVRNADPVMPDDSIRTVVARDAAPGAGVFEWSYGPQGYAWPLVAAGYQGMPYSFVFLDSLQSLLCRSRMTSWNTWEPVSGVAGEGREPLAESHGLATSPVSAKVCITWVRTDTSPMPVYYRLSSDGGATWDSVTQLAWPEAYRGDTVTSFHTSSLSPVYDDWDQLYILASVHPVVDDTAFIMPAEICDWSPSCSPAWSRIHRAGCAPENLLAPVGFNALYAGRPSACCIGWDMLLVVWEQFDSANVDPLTGLLRADIQMSYGEHGSWWTEPCSLASAGTHSCRFPFPVRLVEGESAFVVYELDQVTGFHVLGQGPATYNPVIARRVDFMMDSYGVGAPDTIGGTTYDLQWSGPARRTARLAPDFGLHALWTFSNDTTGSWPDLDTRYNYYDLASHCWSFVDPDFMWSGVNVFAEKAALGCLDAELPVVSRSFPPALRHRSRTPQLRKVPGRKPQATNSEPQSCAGCRPGRRRSTRWGGGCWTRSPECTSCAKRALKPKLKHKPCGRSSSSGSAATRRF